MNQARRVSSWSSLLLWAVPLCQTCYKWPEAELKDRAETIQHRTFASRNRAMDVVVALIHNLAEARKNGLNDHARAGSSVAAQGAVHGGLCRGGEFDGVSCAPGSRVHFRRGDRLCPSGTIGREREPCIQTLDLFFDQGLNRGVSHIPNALGADSETLILF